jgi:DNA-binding SARP family transcriptional activator
VAFEMTSSLTDLELDPSPRALEFRLFGRFVGRTESRDIVGLGGRKMQELLAYLILFHERPHHREALAETIWSEEGMSLDSRKQLRQALWQLRLMLRAAKGHAVLLVEDEWLQVNPVARIWTDVWTMDHAYSTFRGVPGEAMEEDQARRLGLAADLYRADLLEGWYADWCVYERERLRTVYLFLLEKLLAYCEGHELPEEGLFYGERILSFDCAHERTHGRMMRLHVLAGDRTRALRQFDRCALALKEELGIDPSDSTVELRNQIRGDS